MLRMDMFLIFCSKSEASETELENASPSVLLDVASQRKGEIAVAGRVAGDEYVHADDQAKTLTMYGATSSRIAAFIGYASATKLIIMRIKADKMYSSFLS